MLCVLSWLIKRIWMNEWMNEWVKYRLRPERGGKDFRSVQSDHGKRAGDSELSDHTECDSRWNERHVTCKHNTETHKSKLNRGILQFQHCHPWHDHKYCDVSTRACSKGGRTAAIKLYNKINSPHSFHWRGPYVCNKTKIKTGAYAEFLIGGAYLAQQFA